MENESNRGYFVPNIFYDVIVFLTPTLTIFIGVVVGFSVYKSIWASIIAGGNATLSVVIGILIVFFLGYEYGRLAETYSDVFVGGVIRTLRKKKWLFNNCDFQRDLSDQVASLGIDLEMFCGRKKSKWSLYFFALEHAPFVGADLLKRYAWEKLARSEAFAFLCLSCLSLFFVIYNIVMNKKYFASGFEIGNYCFLIPCILMYIVCLVDYYKRNCWNSDLLITAMPIIVDAVKRKENIAAMVLANKEEEEEVRGI